MSIYIYHERQESLLCGQHCLNNLLQDPFFSSVELSNIALELDRQERMVTDSNSNMLNYYREGSGNVDESGNFSLQVLKVGLQRFHSLELISWTGEEGRSTVQDPTQENAFIINFRSHWYTLRKINGKWWNLDSMKPKPEFISPFFLSAFLAQLRIEGSTIFFVKGKIIPYRQTPTNMSLPENCTWFTEKSLLEPESSASNKKPEVVSPFSGTGNRLGSSNSANLNLSIKYEIAPDDDDDTILAKALSASVAEQAVVEEKKALTPADMRAKRLAALTQK